MPKPSSETLHNDIAYYKTQGVSKVISLLHAQEIEKLGMMMEAAACEAHDLKFENFPITDMSVPEKDRLIALQQRLKQEIQSGESIAIHCHGGRGRAGIVAITLMVEHGINADSAIEMASKARGDRMPVNDLQLNFVRSY
ncbi:MAG: hypothetical protein U9R28_08675 [Pseudomonadota bacterium]|nr:hypothetical protein [Pseudomonadota bacterium]